MLVLSRNTDEQIVIGDDIVITIVEIRGDKVRIGIEANRKVPVHRAEVYEAIHGHPPDTKLFPASAENRLNHEREKSSRT